MFHEIYGNYYRTTADILKEAGHGTLTKERMMALVREGAFGESILSIPDGLQGEEWRVLHRDLTSALEHDPLMPMTLLEKQWMKTLLLDPRIQLFNLELTGLEDMEPLFTPDMIVYYDRYTDGDPYQDADYISRFQTILQALREGRSLLIDFESRRHRMHEVEVKPEYLEYSEKDDCFRLVAYDDDYRRVIRLSRIEYCEITDTVISVQPNAEPKMSLTLELVDERKALQRVLLHFSHLEKETKRLDDTHYRVTLKYDREDETEMVIRVLSFGSLVRVVEPESFIGLIRERLRRQKKLG